MEAERGRNKFHVAHEWERGAEHGLSLLYFKLESLFWVMVGAILVLDYQEQAHTQNEGKVHCLILKALAAAEPGGAKGERGSLASFKCTDNQNIANIGHLRNK